MFVDDYNPEIKVIKPFKFVDFIIGITKYKQHGVVGDVLTLVLSTKESTWHLIHVRKSLPYYFEFTKTFKVKCLLAYS
jgi:hypothetical protein